MQYLKCVRESLVWPVPGFGKSLENADENGQSINSSRFGWSRPCLQLGESIQQGRLILSCTFSCDYKDCLELVCHCTARVAEAFTGNAAVSLRAGPTSTAIIRVEHIIQGCIDDIQILQNQKSSFLRHAHNGCLDHGLSIHICTDLILLQRASNQAFWVPVSNQAGLALDPSDDRSRRLCNDHDVTA